MAAKPLGSVTGAKAQNVEFFTSDLIPTLTASQLRITISGTAVNVQVTYDSGTTWITLSAGLTANTVTVFTVGCRGGDLVNFRSTNAAGITLDVCRVDELAEE